MKAFFTFTLILVFVGVSAQDSVVVYTLPCSRLPGPYKRKVPIHHYGYLFWKYFTFSYSPGRRNRSGYFFWRFCRGNAIQELNQKGKWKTIDFRPFHVVTDEERKIKLEIDDREWKKKSQWGM